MSDAVKGLRQKEKHCSTFYFQDHQVGHVGREPPVKPTVAKQFHISTWQMSLKEETERNCFIFNLSCSHPPSQHFKKKKKKLGIPPRSRPNPAIGHGSLVHSWRLENWPGILFQGYSKVAWARTPPHCLRFHHVSRQLTSENGKVPTSLRGDLFFCALCISVISTDATRGHDEEWSRCLQTTEPEISWISQWHKYTKIPVVCHDLWI